MSDFSNYFQQMGFNTLSALPSLGLNTALSGITSALNWKYQKKAMAQQFEYNKQMAELQNMYNIENWKMQNEYNTPKNQVARLVQGGLSPNLAYGQVSPGNASQAPVSVTPEREFPVKQFQYKNYFSVASDFFNLMSLMEDLKTKRKQQELMDEQRKRVEMQTMSEYQDVELKSNRNYGYMLAGGYEYQPQENSYAGNYFKRLFLANLSKLDANIALTSKLSSYRDLISTYQSKINDYFKADKYFHYGDMILNNLFKGLSLFLHK